MQVATQRGASSRSKHLLRRYFTLKQRILAGECNIYHVPTGENPTDMLTKFVPTKKLKASLRYLTGGKQRPAGFVKACIDKKRA